MQPHPRPRAIEIDQTAVRLPRHVRHLPPNRHHLLRYRGPRNARGMPPLITIAAPVRHPAQAPRRRHPDRHLSPARRDRLHQRGGGHDLAQGCHHRNLRVRGNQPGIQPKPANLVANRRFSAIASNFHHLARDFRPQPRLQHPAPLLIYAQKPDRGVTFGDTLAGSHWDRGWMPRLGPLLNIA